MIETLKGEEIIAKTGGRFKLCCLIQRRLGQLMEGARPLVERDGRTDLELVIEEVMRDKLTYEFVESASLEAGAEGSPALPPAD